jgi:hypothetical protein
MTPARADALVLNIGEDIGALVVYTAASCEGWVLDLTPAGAPRTHEIHNVVRLRTTPSGETVFAAVFPEVHQGRYSLWGDAPVPLAQVNVSGGEVCTVCAGDCRRPSG